MATIETLIEQIGDKALRDAVAREVGDLKKRLDWGLVFERHLPESVRALSAPIKVGSVVWERCSAKPRRFRVRAIEGTDLVLAPEPQKTTAPADMPTERLARNTVLVEQDFAEPIFPILTPLGSATLNGPADRARHVVVEGENYHAIQALLTAYEGQIDVMYLDPPYNTGSRDWSYNNDYVDPTDTYRPSKWLAFMERRLRIARRLMKPDGVMVVMIDENEVHHLGMLLEQLFPEARTQMVTIVNNPKGVAQGGLARVEEYAFFCFFGRTTAPSRLDDLLTPEQEAEAVEGEPPRWYGLLRSGTNARRIDRPRLFYPVLIDPKRMAVIGAGEPLIGGEPDREAMVEGNVAVWPIRSDLSLGNWMVGPGSLRGLIARGYVALGDFDARRGTWALRYLGKKQQSQLAAGILEVVEYDAERNAVDVRFVGLGAKIVKTVWHRTRHDAGVGGSDVLTAFLGRTGAFPFAKSLYAVRDTLDILLHDKPHAVVMDFFAGSGTTLHATALLNAEDDGHRRCVLVTNNELNYEASSALHRKGLFRGDAEFEAAGVFESATRPRVSAAITGKRPDGKPVVGTYIDHGRDYSAGFPENVEYFRLDYLEAAEIEFGLRFAEIHPLLWLRAGGIGDREDLDPSQPLGLPAHSPYAVLFDPSGLPELLAALDTRPDISHVFVVADSDDAFNLARIDLPRHIEPVRLYRDYLETMRDATR